MTRRRLLGMPRSPNLLACVGLAGLLLAAGVRAAPPAKTESSDGQSVFSFLPRSLQKNPLVDQTVITEMSEEGKKLPLPSPAHPVYYAAKSAGFKMLAGRDALGEQPPTAAEIEAVMARALAVNGYRPVAAGQPAALLIIYHWGMHSLLDQGSEEVEGSATPDLGHANLLSRAALVGGAKFAAELKRALAQQDSDDEAMTYVNVGVGHYGPLRAFTERDAKTRQLYEESQAPCYYVVVSAYDYAAAAHGEHKLLWRSKLTVEANGVAMADTLPMLIANGAQYLGHDMPEPATMTKPLTREGHTRLGPMKVEEYLEKNPVPETPPPKP